MMALGQLLSFLLVPLSLARLWAQKFLGFGDNSQPFSSRRRSWFVTVLEVAGLVACGLAGIYLCDYELTRSKAELEVGKP